MKNLLIIFMTSTLFGAGLEVSQMTNPKKVYGFLNLFRNWDPSLALVMVGAIAVNALVYLWLKHTRIQKGHGPFMGEKFSLPTSKHIDLKLIMGSTLFGIGWAVAGFCPGPAISGLFRNQKELYLIAGSIIIGMYLFTFLDKFILNRKS